MVFPTPPFIFNTETTRALSFFLFESKNNAVKNNDTNSGFNSQETGGSNEIYSFFKSGTIYYFGLKNQLVIRNIKSIPLMHRSIEILSDPTREGRSAGRTNFQNGFQKKIGHILGLLFFGFTEIFPQRIRSFGLLPLGMKKFWKKIRMQKLDRGAFGRSDPWDSSKVSVESFNDEDNTHESILMDAFPFHAAIVKNFQKI